MTWNPRSLMIILAILSVLGAVLAYEIVATRPVREAMKVYTALVALGNRSDLPEVERLAAARTLCSRQFLERRTLSLGSEGGIAGLPRTINKNFSAWREGPNVWICPTNRIGPVYQFIREDNAWRFDGLVAILRPRGELVPAADVPELEQP